MERHDRAAIVRLFWDSVSEGELRLDGPQAQHARVRRVQPGDAVQLIDGKGVVGSGRIVETGKVLRVVIERVEAIPRPTALDVIVPVADRDRMLIAAEKCVELQVTAWRPAYFARSKSVGSRGEGDKFRAKVRAKMEGALEQCGAAWLPELHDEVPLADALTAVPSDQRRFLLDTNGLPLAAQITSAPVALAVGPEGGIEREELLIAERSGWHPASVARATLRFETAVISGVAIVRAVQQSLRSV